MKKLYY